MNATDNTAVENKNFFSSLFNSYWKPENAFTTAISSVLFIILTGVIYYGWKQPFDGFAAIITTGFGLIFYGCIAGTNHLHNNDKETYVFAPAFSIVFTFLGNISFVLKESPVSSAFIFIIGGIIAGIISGIFACELWKKNRKYYFPFLLVLAIVSALLVFSNQLTETKAGNVDLEMYSKVDGKLAKKSVFIPLFYSTMEDEYSTVVKLAPRKIHVKVTIPDDPKSRWRGEQRLDDTVFVDFQPLNYKAREKILGSGLWQVEVTTTSKVNSSAAIAVEIMKQLNLEPSDVNIKISEIGRLDSCL